LTGIIAGFIGAVISLIMFYLVPDLKEYTLSQAAAQGAPAASIEPFIAIGMYLGLITGPLVLAILGVIISAIAGLIAKKV